MPTAQELNDLAGEIEVNKGLRQIHSKNLEARQPSLFDAATSAENEAVNREGMKKAAVEKLDKQEALKEAQEKAKARAAENEEFKDKRTPKSKMIAEGYLEKMKEMTAPKGRGGASGGAGGIELEGKMGKNTKPKMKAGGSVRSSASKRADGCAQRGKTKGRMV